MSNDYWGQPSNPESNPDNTQGNPATPPVYGQPIYEQTTPAPAQPEPPAPTPDLNAAPGEDVSSQAVPGAGQNEPSPYGTSQVPTPAPESGASNSGYDAPSYGQPAPNYGQPTPNYGQPAPNYGQPTPNYGTTPDAGISTPSYGQPAPSTPPVDNPYGQSHGAASGYGSTGATDPYGQQAQPAAPQTSYGQPTQPTDALGQPGGYGTTGGYEQPATQGYGYGTPNNTAYNPALAGAGMVPTGNTGMSQFGPLASWGKRALGGLIDWVIPGMITSGIGRAIDSALTTSIYDPSTIGSNLGSVVFLAWAIYNMGYLGGTTGQSFGRKVAKTRMVSATNGQYIGVGKGILRYFAHIVDSLICLVGWLFPLWDANRQTLADKIVGTVVIDEEAAAAQGYGQQGGYGS